MQASRKVNKKLENDTFTGCATSFSTLDAITSITSYVDSNISLI